MALIVVESPTKARTFNRILKSKEWGSNYFVFATVGHFRDLPSKSIAIDFSHDFKPEYEIMEKKVNMVEKLQSLAKEHGEVILATDPDREGEAISYHVAYMLERIDEQWPDFQIRDATHLKRIIFHEITPKALEEALNNPESLRINLVKAQQARRILDRIVGYELSPLLWKKTGKNWLSAGRVQTVALRLIAEREKEIVAFAQQPYIHIFTQFSPPHSLEARLIGRNGELYDKTTTLTLFDGTYQYASSTISTSTAPAILDDLRSDTFTISEVKVDSNHRFPPPPYTTSLLQQDSFQKLGYPSKLTMRMAQSLYEKGLITYHRTDSFQLSSKYVFSAKDYIAKKYGEAYALEKPRGFKTKSKNAQEAHEAIRPTQADRAPEKVTKKLSEQEKKVYELIFYRALATQMKEAQVKQTQVFISTEKGYQLMSEHVQVLFDGFMKVLMPQYVAKHIDSVTFTQGTVLTVGDIRSEEKQTRPPYRYNEASLIRTMEEKGIGRPSTYAAIISLIVEKHYVEKERRYMKPTILGSALSDYLSGAFPDIFDLQFTAQMEDKLDAIAQGDVELLQTLKEFYTPFEKELVIQKEVTAQIQIAEDKLEEKCPQCGSDLVARYGKYGKFYACKGFPNCRYIKPNLHVVKNHVCPLCGGNIVVRYSKKGKRFYGCANYPKCTHVQWALNVESTASTPKTEETPVKSAKKKRVIRKKPAVKK